MGLGGWAVETAALVADPIEVGSVSGCDIEADKLGDIVGV